MIEPDSRLKIAGDKETRESIGPFTQHLRGDLEKAAHFHNGCRVRDAPSRLIPQRDGAAVIGYLIKRRLQG